MTKTPQSSASRKMAIIKKMDGSILPGYVSPSGLARAESIDLLTPDGEHQSIDVSSVQRVFFVRDLAEPVEVGRRAFLSRPKLPGLWVRMTFRDGDTLEGIVTNDLLDLLDNGLQVVPPDFSGNCHRIFAPRAALAGVAVLGVVGAARRPMPRRPKEPQADIQRGLFEATED